MDISDYVKKLYEPFESSFQLYLDELEEMSTKDEKAAELYKKYSVLNDPTIPQDILNRIYAGFIYEHYLATTGTPKVVTKKREILYETLTNYVILKFCIVTFNKIVYIYKNNMFIENKGEVEKEIKRILTLQGISETRTIRYVVSEVMQRVVWDTFFREFPFNRLRGEFIPLRNGVLWRGPEYRLFPHSPAFGYSYRLPINYNPEAKCEKIDKFISEIVDEKNRPILYEIPALCLLQSRRYDYSYMLVGSGANGKSTYLDMLQFFLGKENVANVSLQELVQDKYKAAQLVGKLANIYADIPKKALKDTGKFKMLVSGDRMTVERKYKDPFEFENVAKLIFSSNELPEVNDRTEAFWRRWILIEFPRKFPPNPQLLDELTTDEELSGFLNKVLEYMSKIELRGVTQTEVVEKLKQEWMKRANSIYGFAHDCLEKAPGHYEVKDEVYSYYVEYCKQHNYNVISKNIFAQELQKYVPIKSRRRKIGTEKVYVWEGIRLKREYFEDFEEEEEQTTTLSDYSDYDEWELDDLI